MQSTLDYLKASKKILMSYFWLMRLNMTPEPCQSDLAENIYLFVDTSINMMHRLLS